VQSSVSWKTLQKALLLFTKVPQPGRVKTRLLGPYGLSSTKASELYSAILIDIFGIMTELARSEAIQTFVCYTPQNEEHRIRELLDNDEPVGASFLPQKEEATTAQRISIAFNTAFSEGSDISVMIFGDQPRLDLQLLLEAFQILEEAARRKEQHLVLGPTCDGGTYLIGLTSGLANWLHNSVDCTSTSKAVSRLVAKARANNVPFTLLDERIDLDDLDDLMLLRNRRPTNYPRTLTILETLPPQCPQDMNSIVSVIIPTLNEEKTLERTIQSVRANLYPSEIIVSDGGSGDRTLEIANRLADRVIVTGHRGRQHQENLGAKGAKGDTLLFLHADAVIPPTMLENMMKALQNDEIVAGGAHLMYSSPERFRYRALCVLRDLGSRILGISGMGSSFFIRKETFRLLSGFDEGMNEEAVDMCKRLRALGKHVMLDDVVHTSARRYERLGFFPTVLAWVITISLSYFGVRAVPIEKYLWRVAR
jgi:glycosyltransferase A (GT-A) superfamily protein (DUF2064 family)